MDKNKVYKEMCDFLANQEQPLQEFKAFHEQNRNNSNYEELFDDTYGAMYDSFKSSEKTDVPHSNPTAIEKQTINNIPPVSTLSQEECYKDIRTIRKWVQFLGWLTVISIIIYMIFLIIGLSNS